MVIIILIKIIRVIIIIELPNNDPLSIIPLHLEIPGRCPAVDSLSHG